MKKILWKLLSVVFVAPLLALSLPSFANECPIAGPYEPCTGCHVPGVNPNVQLAAETWIMSEHFNGVTFGPDFCKNCHQPFRTEDLSCGEPDREYGVECAACHTDHTDECGRELRVWDRATCDVGPLIGHDDLNALCLTCHDRPDITGHSAFNAKPKGWARAMAKHKDVQCVDCHMPIVPFTDQFGFGTEGRTHDMEVTGNLPFSCGTMAGGCHANKTSDWAVKQILKNKIHGEVD